MDLTRAEEYLADILANSLSDHKTAAIILAAGNSSRMGGTNKQLEEIDGVPVLARTLLAYEACPLIHEIILVLRLSDFQAAKEIQKKYQISKLAKLVSGGQTRQDSAKLGLDETGDDIRYVAIADGARCLITSEDITRVCLAAYRHHAASAAHKVSDTVKRANSLGGVIETVDRSNLWTVQTPQVFNRVLYITAHAKANEDGFCGTDDNSLVEHLGYRVYLEECGSDNLKITTPEDLTLARAIIKVREEKA
ncbi:MAG: 2-C-methyl-D-erythritol 4-phosphate cytidylyltransferase [Clostridia bacterium]|nr:2-C-methyl-D-erythritol 4-phosphate cytidylyltransferase [Clostridia bacterium]